MDTPSLFQRPTMIATGIHSHTNVHTPRTDAPSSSVRAHPYYIPALPRDHHSHTRRSPKTPPMHPPLCEYRSKVCMNNRARKRDGSLHRYCEHHHQRANINQKKWANRRLHTVRELEHQYESPFQPLPSYQQLLALSNGNRPSCSNSDSESTDTARSTGVTGECLNRENSVSWQAVRAHHNGELVCQSEADETREYSF